MKHVIPAKAGIPLLPSRGKRQWDPCLRRGDFMVLTLTLLFSACSGPETVTIDGSSPATFAQTTQQARQDLPQAEKLDFDRALASLPTRRFGSADPEALRRTTFDGLTAAQVVEDFRRRQ